jgi:hypothetical protein
MASSSYYWLVVMPSFQVLLILPTYATSTVQASFQTEVI